MSITSFRLAREAEEARKNTEQAVQEQPIAAEAAPAEEPKVTAEPKQVAEEKPSAVASVKSKAKTASQK
jgi:hypothetical protein